MQRDKEHEASMLELAMRQFEENGMDTEDVHGPEHWAMVSKTAEILLSANGHNPIIGTYFGIFHDCCRENDYEDPQHGNRAADFIKTIRNQLRINDEEFKSLHYAIEIHHTPETPGYESIEGCCLDGDRLDLGRAGIQLHTRYLSTRQALELVESRETLVTSEAGILACLWHGSDRFEPGEDIRLRSRAGIPLYFSEKKEISLQYGKLHRVILAVDSMLDLTDPYSLIHKPEFQAIIELEKELKKEGNFNCRISGEPLSLTTMLESGELYFQDESRRLTERIVEEILSNTGHAATRIFEDSNSHNDPDTGTAIPTWMTYESTNTILC